MKLNYFTLRILTKDIFLTVHIIWYKIGYKTRFDIQICDEICFKIDLSIFSLVSFLPSLSIVVKMNVVGNFGVKNTGIYRDSFGKKNPSKCGPDFPLQWSFDFYDFWSVNFDSWFLNFLLIIHSLKFQFLFLIFDFPLQSPFMVIWHT